MANYGPPGGGPSDPWRERRPEQAYGQPADPWGQDDWDDRTGRDGSGEAGHPVDRTARQPYPPGQRGYQPYPPDDPYPDQRVNRGGPPAAGAPFPPPAGPPPPFAPPAAPPPGGGRGRGAVVAVLVLLSLLVLGGTAAFLYLNSQDEPVRTGGSAPASRTPGASATPGSPSPTPAPSSAAPQSSTDPRFVKVGQCVRNEAAAGAKPKLAIAPCAPSNYEVLRRIDGPTSGEKDAEAKCARVDGYTNWFFFDSELDTLDYVLCLKLR